MIATYILGDALMKSSIVKRSVVINGHKTSVSLEDAFWSGLKDIAHAECVALSTMVAEIDKTRQGGNLSSALRLFVLDRVRRPSSSNKTMSLYGNVGADANPSDTCDLTSA
jgi:predicted DNA-binding ribbon-helix-helix protein